MYWVTCVNYYYQFTYSRVTRAIILTGVIGCWRLKMNWRTTVVWAARPTVAADQQEGCRFRVVVSSQTCRLESANHF